MRREKKMARLLEAATRDRNPRRFYEEFHTALEAGEIRPEDYSIRDLFESVVPNGRELINSWRETRRGGYDLDAIPLVEAHGVGMQHFTHITGSMIYTKVKEPWSLPQFIHDKLVETVPSDLKQEEFPGIGGFGDQAEVVGEFDEYPMAGLNEEVIRMPATAKRGFQVAVSKEIVMFDRFGDVLRRAAEVGEWLALNKEKRILDAVLGITNTYIRNDVPYNTYLAAGAYINVKASNALADWTNVEAAELLWDDMTDPNTGELISVAPEAIIVPSALKYTARRVLHATEVRSDTNASAGTPTRQTLSANPLDDPLEIVTGPYVKSRSGSASTWFIGAPKKAFAYIENQPLTVEAAPIGDRSFSRDIVAGWKASERGVVGVKEPRYVIKCTA